MREAFERGSRGPSLNRRLMLVNPAGPQPKTPKKTSKKKDERGEEESDEPTSPKPSTKRKAAADDSEAPKKITPAKKRQKKVDAEESTNAAAEGKGSKGTKKRAPRNAEVENEPEVSASKPPRKRGANTGKAKATKAESTEKPAEAEEEGRSGKKTAAMNETPGSERKTATKAGARRRKNVDLMKS